MKIDLNAFWTAELEEHRAVLDETQENLKDAFAVLVETCTECIADGGKIMFCGNGGSAADAQHLSTELAVRYAKDRVPIASVALTTDTSALTAIGNDFGFEHLFARQVEALGNPGDVLIGISTSGTSQNVLRALEQARKMEISTVGFTGGAGGHMGDLCDVILKVPSSVTARIQEMHITLGQMLCGALEQNLGLVETAHPSSAVA